MPLFGKLGLTEDIAQELAHAMLQQIPAKRFGKPGKVATVSGVPRVRRRLLHHWRRVLAPRPRQLQLVKNAEFHWLALLRLSPVYTENFIRIERIADRWHAEAKVVATVIIRG
jgi:hypothetical protein